MAFQVFTNISKASKATFRTSDSEKYFISQRGKIVKEKKTSGNTKYLRLM